jgi:hypothetical protein
MYARRALATNKVEVTVILWPMVSKPACLGVKHPSVAQDQILITVRQLQICWCGTPSLMRGQVCHLQLLLATILGSLTRGGVCHLQLLLGTVLGSKSSRTHDHILLFQIWNTSNLEGQIPVFTSPRNRVAQLYPRALGSLFVTSYDLQGYSGDMGTRLYVGKMKAKPCYNWWSVGQSVLLSESELLYDWQFTTNQLVLAPSPLRLTARDFSSCSWTLAIIVLT